MYLDKYIDNSTVKLNKMTTFIKYKQCYPTYFENNFSDNQYFFRNHLDEYIMVMKKTNCTTTNCPTTKSKILNCSPFVASQLEVVIIFNKFRPEKRMQFFEDQKIMQNVTFYLSPVVPYYEGLNNLKHFTGKYCEWYTCGSKKMDGHIEHGKKEGLFTEYFVTGKVKSRGKILNGLKSGVWVFFSEMENGQVSHVEYKSGMMSGKVIIWKDEKMKVKLKEYQMLNDKKHGPYAEYFGNITIDRKYCYYESLNIDVKEKGFYYFDQKVGHWIEHISEEFYSKGTYINGRRKGFWTIYHAGGRLCEKHYY